MQNPIFIAQESSQYLGFFLTVRKQDWFFLLFMYLKTFLKKMIFVYINENYNDFHQQNTACTSLSGHFKSVQLYYFSTMY